VEVAAADARSVRPHATNMTHKRSLTTDELFVLGLVQEIHGAQNTPGDVFYTEDGEACISARDQDGQSRVFVNLTNLGEWYRLGQLPLEDLKLWISAEHAA
jgi:hypothetical protein